MCLCVRMLIQYIIEREARVGSDDRLVYISSADSQTEEGVDQPRWQWRRKGGMGRSRDWGLPQKATHESSFLIISSCSKGDSPRVSAVRVYTDPTHWAIVASKPNIVDGHQKHQRPRVCRLFHRHLAFTDSPCIVKGEGPQPPSPLVFHVLWRQSSALARVMLFTHEEWVILLNCWLFGEGECR